LRAAGEAKALREPLQGVSLCALSINLADDFQPLGWDKDIQIGVKKESFDSAPEVLVIKPLISQAFCNIIENAVKYSRNGSRIEISGMYNKNEDTVSVQVSNTGIPLPMDVMKVFDRGFRSDEAKNKYPAGTGFGLYIAKRIVEIHKGKIVAHTSIRGSVVFTVTLSVRELEGETRYRGPKNGASR
jgi:signal transduction histidine kinase